MGGRIRSAVSNGQLGRLIGGTLAALSASAALVMMPTKATALDIGGMIGTAMAIQMHGYRGISGGYGHARNRGESHSDSDSDDHGSSSRGGGERDASAPDAVDRSTRSDNRLAMHREIRGPSSTSGGLAQASERDAAADQGPGSGRTFDDQPAFKPAR